MLQLTPQLTCAPFNFERFKGQVTRDSRLDPIPFTVEIEREKDENHLLLVTISIQYAHREFTVNSYHPDFPKQVISKIEVLLADSKLKKVLDS